MAIRKKVNGRTDNTMAIRKKSKSKDRQYKRPQKGVKVKTEKTIAL